MKAHDPTARILTAASAGYKGHMVDFYKAIRITRQTFANKKRYPRTLTIGELRRIINISAMGDADIIKIVRGTE